MGQKHIALFISSLHKGGSERVMVNLAQYFVGRGYQVSLVTQYKQENEYPLPDGVCRILSDITPEEEKNGRIGNFYARYHKLRGIWKQIKPDIILSFIGKNNMMAILTSVGLHIPVVVSVRGEPTEEYYTKSLRLCAKLLYRRAAGVILQTTASKDFFPKAVQNRSVIIPNGLSNAFIRPVYEGEREHTIVAVGRVDANKNHEMLLKAFREVSKAHPDYKLIIYGEGECRKKLQDLVGQWQMKDKISLPGAINNVPDAIEKAGIFVLCSDTEGLPNTLLEAMALGIPCISTDCPCGGPRDIIQNEENGLLIPVRNQQKLQDAIHKLIENKELNNKICKNSVKTQEKYNPDLINGLWEEYLCSKM